MWYIDTTRIFVSDSAEETGTIIARLQPIVDETVLQIFGYEKPIVKLKGVLVGIIDKEALEGFGKDGALHTISGPYGMRDFYVAKVGTNQMMSIRQTVRQDLDEDSPVYAFDIELYE
jgi:hypothetical protein